MQICIGIVSYLPEEKEIRDKRLSKLNLLLLKCDEIFKLPIIIIAQNWRNETLPRLKNSKLIIHNYKEPLGITGARKILRSVFLTSYFDYLIMLDDDSELYGDSKAGEQYIAQIEEHPGMYGVFKTMLLKLFAISKEVYSLIDFPDGEAGNGDFFEDMYLIMALNKLHPDKRFRFKRNLLIENSNSSDDPLSTWWKHQYIKKNMGDKTRNMIKEL